MSKWRPSKPGLYVIGDIHGNYKSLVKVLNRVLPLRKNDKIVFLGDYIDRGPDSAKVIDTLVKLKDKYPTQIICLMGNHEWLFLAALGITNPKTPPGIYPVDVWLDNGGVETILSYASLSDIDIKNVLSIPLHRIKNIIPKDHFDFLRKTYVYYELGKYIFVHAGCDPYYPLDKQSNDVLLWDRSLYKFVLSHNNFLWNKVIVCGHCGSGPVIRNNYMMIDVSEKNKLLCIELNSMEGFYAKAGQSRMVKADLKSRA